MRLSNLLLRTLRQDPAEADNVSHRLLVRAGMIQQLAAGIYALLPMGLRVHRKIEQIIREEMNAVGGQELVMPVLQPLEIWEESGRAAALGEILFRLQDRKARRLALGPTHEEVVTNLVQHQVRSYRDLPLMLYQIQTKFRDEPRPRGGLIRVREFTMMDMYSFDVDQKGLDASYQKVAQAYRNIYARCGLAAIAVEADSGAIGGKDSHEFILVADTGEDEIVYCAGCGYGANVERAQGLKFRWKDDPLLPLEEVSTPGIKTIDALSSLLRIAPAETLKAVFYSADGQVVFVVIRGDMEVNEVKLKNALKVNDLRLAYDEEVQSAGLVAGSASPIGLSGIKIIADESIMLGSNFVAGGNKVDTHVRNVNYPRDFQADLVIDIAKVKAGQSCPHCGGELQIARGIEVGHIFKLGTVFSERFGATFLDKDGTPKPAVMGCYGIGLGRLLAAAVEQNQDEKGIIWPPPIAPFHIHLIGLGMDNAAVAGAAEELYSLLLNKGFEVLFDDRLESPGVKFNDADLLGIPVRVTVSQRTLKTRSAELKLRMGKDCHLVSLQAVAESIRSLLTQSSAVFTQRNAQLPPAGV